MKPKYHPLSEYLPIMPGHELDELAADIKEHGLRDPIIMFEKKILDGRNRYLACQRAKVKPRFRELNKDDNPLVFVVSMNVARRHLTPSQKSMVIAKLIAETSNWKPTAGQPTNKSIMSTDIILSPTTTVARAAKIAGVSASSVTRAKDVMEHSEQKADEVSTGKKSVSRAARETREEKAVSNGAKDSLGYPIPEPALPYWNRTQEVKDVLKQLSKLKSWAEDLHTRQDPMYCEVNTNWLRIELGNIYRAVKGALPYVVCTACQGQLPDSCTLCKRRGVISEFRWTNALPIETRAMREAQIKGIEVKLD